MEYTELKNRLDSRGYNNWIKAGLCLHILKTALAPYADKEMKRFYVECLILNRSLLLRCEEGCSLKSKNLSSLCPLCSEWSKVITRHHRQPDGTTVNWENCSPARWSQDHLELAKAYMPRGLFRVTSFDKCDASALLNLLNFCDWFSSVGPSTVVKVIQCRNEQTHSSDLNMEDDWMKGFHKVLDNLLVELQLPEAQQEIHEIFKSNLCITLDSDQTGAGAAVDKGVFSMTATTIRELEAELLRERLQGLRQDIQTQTLCLLRQRDFIQSHRDLSEYLSDELQAIAPWEAAAAAAT